MSAGTECLPLLDEKSQPLFEGPTLLPLPLDHLRRRLIHESRVRQAAARAGQKAFQSGDLRPDPLSLLLEVHDPREREEHLGAGAEDGMGPGLAGRQDLDHLQR